MESKSGAVTRSSTTIGNAAAAPRRLTSPPAFSCRRWYRLTGKTPRDSDSSSRPSTSVRPARVAVSPPRHWSVRAARGFVDVFPSAPAPRSPPYHHSTPGASTTIATSKSPVGAARAKQTLKWREIERFEPTVMKQLVDVAYGIRRTEDGTQALEEDVLGLTAMDDSQRRAAERRLVRDHVYLPSVHRTLNFLQKARLQQHHSQQSNESKAKEPPGDPPIARRPAPLGVNLLSDQLQELQEELMAQLATEHGSPPVYGTRVWLPQPPDVFRGAPSKSSTGSIRSRRVQQSSSTSSVSKSQYEDEEYEEAPSSESETPLDQPASVGESSDHSLHNTMEEDSASTLSSYPSTVSSGAAGDDEATWPTPVMLEAPMPVRGASWDSLETHVLHELEPSTEIPSTKPSLLQSQTQDVQYNSGDLALFADGASDSDRGAVDREFFLTSSTETLPSDGDVTAKEPLVLTRPLPPESDEEPGTSPARLEVAVEAALVAEPACVHYSQGHHDGVGGEPQDQAHEGCEQSDDRAFLVATRSTEERYEKEEVKEPAVALRADTEVDVEEEKKERHAVALTNEHDEELPVQDSLADEAIVEQRIESTRSEEHLTTELQVVNDATSPTLRNAIECDEKSMQVYVAVETTSEELLSMNEGDASTHDHDTSITKVSTDEEADYQEDDEFVVDVDHDDSASPASISPTMMDLLSTEEPAAEHYDADFDDSDANAVDDVDGYSDETFSED
ncbi:hypothetical protein PINS_up009104 [Pythium insidiosum]|nr:hypothetical protein PINS_up009104 [Pythium insidiosum]